VEFERGNDLGMIWVYHYKEIICYAGFSELRAVLPALRCADLEEGNATWLTTWIRQV